MVATSPLHLNSSATLVGAALWRRGDCCVRSNGKTSQTFGSSATTQSWQPTMFASDAPLHVWHNGTTASWACCSRHKLMALNRNFNNWRIRWWQLPLLLWTFLYFQKVCSGNFPFQRAQTILKNNKRERHQSQRGTQVYCDCFVNPSTYLFCFGRHRHLWLFPGVKQP